MQVHTRNAMDKRDPGCKNEREFASLTTLYFLQNSRISIDCETYVFLDPKLIANLF